MLKTLPIAVATALYFQAVHASEKPISFCTKGGCEEDNCPVALATAGTGYPNCVIYDSKDLFSQELGFSTSAHGYVTLVVSPITSSLVPADSEIP